MPDPELISILDCPLCRVIPPVDKAKIWGSPPEHDPPPLPPCWSSLSTVAVLAPGFASTWGDRDELRMCPSCGTYYEYRQIYESSELFRAESTTWFLSRLTPGQAVARQGRVKPPRKGSEAGNVKRRYRHMIKALRSDLGRVQEDTNHRLKQYVIQSVLEHDADASDWDALKTTLLDHPDAAVRVATAHVLLWRVIRALDCGKRGPMRDYAIATNRLITKERRQLLIAIAGEGLSHHDETAGDAADEPAGVDRAALITLRDCDGYMNLAPAIPWIAAWLAGEDAWRRQKARDFLVGYVVKPWRLSQGPNTLKLRARDVLAAVSGIDNDEARAVVRHCREKSE